jgi:hypothetical protein
MRGASNLRIRCPQGRGGSTPPSHTPPDPRIQHGEFVRLGPPLEDSRLRQPAVR